ncbi:MAG TPA: hypothetical protein VFO44_17730 [Steroidobacteraceae bacterium]|nr:hypothetical protein [Steroidobacteraceae bacterium]
MIRFFRLWRMARQDLRLLWYALWHPGRPVWLWPAALVLTAYAIDPLNLAIPALGLIDDFILLPLALHWMLKLLPLDIRVAYARRSLARS